MKKISLFGGHLTWAESAFPVQSQFAVSASGPWHSNMDVNDKYRRDKIYDGTWGTPFQFKGQDGHDGSDAKVPKYITTTKITKTTIESPEIIGGLIQGGELRVTGEVLSDHTGISEFGIYDASGAKFGVIRFDDNGAGTPEEAEKRVFICTEGGKALKIQSGDGISIEAGEGKKIYIASEVVFAKPTNVQAVFG